MTTFADGHATNLARDSAGPLGYGTTGHSTTSNEFLYLALNNDYAWDEAVRVTVSFDLEMTVAKANPVLYVYNSNWRGPMAFEESESGGGSDTLDIWFSAAAGETIRQRVAVTGWWHPRASGTVSHTTNKIDLYSVYGTGNYFTVSNVMFELGEVAHPWAPSPFDEGVVGMIKALDEITITDQTDIDSIVTWYRLTTSATKPSAPTTTKTSDAVSDWTTAEPTFSAGTATNYLYTVQQTRWKDGSCEWGSVQLSSSYEQAKQAWNKANAAQQAATSAQDAVDNLQIGGRNLLPQTGFSTTLTKWTDAGGKAVIDTSVKHNGRNTLKLTTPTSARFTLINQYMPSYSAGDTLVFSMYVMSPDVSKITSHLTVYVAYRTSSYTPNGSTLYNIPITSFTEAGNNGWFKITFTSSSAISTNIYATFIVETYSPTAVIYLSDLKLEKGNKPTDWTPAPEDQEAAIAAVQSDLDSTRSWYATSSTAAGTTNKVATITPATTAFTLSVGTVVNVEFSATNSAAVADLTLNVNDTGAKSIKYMYNNTRSNLPAVGYLVAGIIYQFMYDGDYWTIQNIHYNTNNNDTARYVQYYNTIVAGEALTAQGLIGAHEDGKFYQIAGANDYFMLSSPLLWLTANLNANATNYANIYTQIYDRNLATYYTSFANTEKNCIVYLKGTVDGDKFTVYGSNSGAYLTVTEPTTEDGCVYIPLGRLGNGSNGKNYFNYQVGVPVTLYAFLDGKFRQVTPTEIVATQRIYYRCSVSTATPNTAITKPTGWVTENGDKRAANLTTAANWSLKKSSLAASTAEGQTKYLYLYTCEQRKRLDGTIEYTTVVIDDGATVIDGGQIVTNSITATQIAANAITAEEIDATNLHVSAANIDGTLTIGKVNGLQSALDGKQAAGDYATKTQAQGYATTAKSEAISAAENDASSKASTAEANAKSYMDDALAPIATKTYTGVIGTANNVNDASFYFAKVHPTSYDGTWVVKLRIEVTAPTTYQETVDISISGRANVVLSYDSYVARSTAALALYFVNLYRATSAGITAGVGHALGFGLRATTNPANASYARTIRVDVLETVNCSVSMLDSAVKYDSMPGYSTTNYSGVNELGVPNNGQNATGNSDTYNRIRWQNVIRAIATANSVTSGHIICGTSAGYRDIAAGAAFDLSYPLLYAGTTIAAASGTTDNTYLSINSITVTTNGTVQGAAQYATVYLKGTLSGNTLTIAASNFLTCVVPTAADGYVYIPLGMFYNSTTYIYFNSSKELWAYVDGAFGPVSIREASAAAKTATNYITADANGISIHMQGNSTTYQRQTASGTTFYVDGKKRSTVGADGLRVYVESTETEVASFTADGAVIGASDSTHTVIDAVGLSAYAADGTTLFEAASSGTTEETSASILYANKGIDEVSFSVTLANGSSYTKTLPQLTLDTGDSNPRYKLEWSFNSSNWIYSSISPSLDASSYMGYGIRYSYTSSTRQLKITNESSSSAVLVKFLNKMYAVTRTSSAPYFTFGTRKDDSVIGGYSSSLGINVTASGQYSHAEGQVSKATGNSAHAEGYRTTASSSYSHAEGFNTTASSSDSHAEGSWTTASGVDSHAEGYYAKASGADSHSEGYYSEANGAHSHAQNKHTIAGYDDQTTIGRYNDNIETNAFEIGNGESNTVRSNALAVDWDGNLTLAGGITLGTPLTADQIPSLSADKITSGTLGVDRIPTITRAKGGTGVTAKQTGTMTLNTDNCTASTSYNYACHNGVVATVQLGYFKLKSALASDSTIAVGTVPSGFRPASRTFANVAAANAAVSGFISAYVNSDGTIGLINRSGAALSTSVAFAITATYCI